MFFALSYSYRYYVVNPESGKSNRKALRTKSHGCSRYDKVPKNLTQFEKKTRDTCNPLGFLRENI